MIFAAEARGAAHHGVMVEDAAVAQLDFVAHDGVRRRCGTPLPKFARGRNDRARIDCHSSRTSTHRHGSRAGLVDARACVGFAVHHLAHQGGFGGELAIHSGQPCSLQNVPRQASTVTSMRN